jgi:hypothetical protein
MDMISKAIRYIELDGQKASRGFCVYSVIMTYHIFLHMRSWLYFAQVVLVVEEVIYDCFSERYI